MSEALLAEFEAAKARVDQLARQIAAGPCKAVGHDWQSTGGCNAGCGPDCFCSVPVNVCAKCGDCDYGENEDADKERARCAALHPAKEEQ